MGSTGSHLSGYVGDKLKKGAGIVENAINDPARMAENVGRSANTLLTQAENEAKRPLRRLKGSLAPPELPTGADDPQPASVEEVQAGVADKTRRRIQLSRQNQGMGSTVLTGPSGTTLGTDSTTPRKTLLGS